MATWDPRGLRCHDNVARPVSSARGAGRGLIECSFPRADGSEPRLRGVGNVAVEDESTLLLGELLLPERPRAVRRGQGRRARARAAAAWVGLPALLELCKKHLEQCLLPRGCSVNMVNE